MPRKNISSGGPFEPVFGYCRAVRVGDVVHVSGTTALEGDGSVQSSDCYDQAMRTFEIIRGALEDAGATMAEVVRSRVYIVDLDDIDKITRAHGEVFGGIRPASTMVQVAGLLRPELVVEIEVDAIIGGAA